MGQFGNVAFQAAQLLQNNQQYSAEQAWFTVINSTNLAPSTKAKGCPRYAFIGLCEYGCIAGVSATKNLPPTELNALYALEGLRILNNRIGLGADRNMMVPSRISLWRDVLHNLAITDKSHNSQMDVVIELWVNDLI